MSALRAMCEAAGFARVRTYIASGNVVFESAETEQAVRRVLEGALEDHAGKSVGVLVRTANEMAEVLAANPFPEAAPNQTVAILLNQPPPPDALAADRKSTRLNSSHSCSLRMPSSA